MINVFQMITADLNSSGPSQSLIRGLSPLISSLNRHHCNLKGQRLARQYSEWRESSTNHPSPSNQKQKEGRDHLAHWSRLSIPLTTWSDEGPVWQSLILSLISHWDRIALSLVTRSRMGRFGLCHLLSKLPISFIITTDYRIRSTVILLMNNLLTDSAHFPFRISLPSSDYPLSFVCGNTVISLARAPTTILSHSEWEYCHPSPFRGFLIQFATVVREIPKYRYFSIGKLANT